MQRRNFVASLLALALAQALALSPAARADLVVPPPARVRIALADGGRVPAATPIPEHLELRITNDEARSLELRVERLVLVDPSGMRLPLRVVAVSHEGREDRAITLAPGASATLSIRFADFPERQARALSRWDIEVTIAVPGSPSARDTVRLTRAR